jgi:uncharacterized RDD family membrane protein YckC
VLVFLQVYLLIAAAEWLRSLFWFVDMYEKSGVSWTRLAVILGLVATFTFFSTLLFFCPAVRNYYNPDQ